MAGRHVFLKDESGVNKNRSMPCASITSDLINEKTRANLPHVPTSTGLAAKPETRDEHFQCHS